jgi:hypothetical protein
MQKPVGQKMATKLSLILQAIMCRWKVENYFGLLVFAYAFIYPWGWEYPAPWGVSNTRGARWGEYPCGLPRGSLF